MPLWTMLMVKVQDGNAKAGADAHTRRRAIEEAAESIPGFLHGETIFSIDETDLFCVLCAWEGEAAYQEWKNSPVRAKQVEDLAGIIAVEMNTRAFESVHVLEKPKSSFA